MDTSKPILIVDSKQSADAARTLLGTYYEVFLCDDFEKSDRKEFDKRKVLIWPNASLSGIRNAYEIARTLTEHCAQIKIVQAWEATA